MSKSMAEMEAEIAELRARLANQQVVSFVVYSNCGKKVNNKAGDKEVTCKVDLKTLKCEHGGTPKGNFGFIGLQRFPITVYLDQLRRLLPVAQNALALGDANDALFARKAE